MYIISASSITETKSYKTKSQSNSDEKFMLMFMIITCVPWNLTSNACLGTKYKAQLISLVISESTVKFWLPKQLHRYPTA